MAAVGATPNLGTTGYRRRRPLPAVLMILGLIAAAVVVWSGVLDSTEQVEAGSCPSPAAELPAGQRIGPDGLDPVAPAPPQQTQVRVLNANGQRGQAGAVASQLHELGFGLAGEATNDPGYPAFDLSCYGQIRFGEAGAAAARTLSLLVPCAELVRDARPDPTVDLALGTEFDELAPSAEAREALEQLAALGQPPPVFPPAAQGGQAAEPVVPTVDPQLVQAARESDC